MYPRSSKFTKSAEYVGAKTRQVATNSAVELAHKAVRKAQGSMPRVYTGQITSQEKAKPSARRASPYRFERKRSDDQSRRRREPIRPATPSRARALGAGTTSDR